MADDEHDPLPNGEWWACERPEAKPEPYRQRYRRGCESCFVAWRAAAAQPRATFLFANGDGAPRALHPGHSEAEIRAWFMECIVPEGATR